MRHTIRQQIFDLWVDRRLDAFAVQQRVSDRFWTDILPEMEELFDEVADAESTIKIETLEIDLGSITQEMIDTGAWAALFREELHNKLQEAMREVELQRGISIEPSFQSSFGQWYYFLQHGCLPWSAGKPSAKWFEKVLESIARSYNNASRVRSLLAGNASVAKRMVLYHPPDFLSHIVELLTAEKQQALPAVVIQFSAWLQSIHPKHAPVSADAGKDIERKIWMAVLQRSAVQQTGLDTATLIEYLFTGWLQLTPVELLTLVQLQPAGKTHDQILAVIGNIIKDIPGSAQRAIEQPPVDQLKPEQKTENISVTAKENEKKLLAEEKAATVAEAEQAQQQLSDKLAERSATAEEIAESEPGAAAEEGIYITQAGLVLLHPFLHTFFRKLKLVENGVFADTVKQERAVCLLHELAISGGAIYEHELPLAKLLCGWPLQMPVNTAIEFTEEEKNEAHQLLEAAIAQWEILKNTSPLALQETFLQREGKLFYKHEKWYLQVEKKPVDILLSHLPWMISMVKLPWMKELLRVEWV